MFYFRLRSLHVTNFNPLTSSMSSFEAVAIGATCLSQRVRVLLQSPD